MAGELSLHNARTRARGRIGHYRVISMLGEGGMGVVHLAEDEVLGRRVALKLLAPGLAESADFRERFVRESRLAASIEHPNIVPIYEAGEADGTLFIAMRFIDGTDMRELLAAEGPLELVRSVELAGQVAAALDAAHRVSLVHRDVKPANVMIDGSGGGDHCYLTDFGLTKNLSASTGYTATGQVVGTLSYVAPEQILGGPLSPRADVYALGCVLFECLTGTVPFQREHDVAVMYAHMNEPPPAARALRPQLPEGVDNVLARAMAKSPEDRHASCGELASDMAAAVAGVPMPAFEPTRRSPRRFSRPAAPPPTAAAPPAAGVPPAAPPTARPPAVPPPVRNTPVLMPAPPAPRPSRREGRQMRAALIVAAAILLCTGGVAAALILSGGQSGGRTAAGANSHAKRILDETIALNRDLRREAVGLKNNGARDAKVRARLADDEKRAKSLAAQAQAQLTDLKSKLTSINRKLAKTAHRLKQYTLHPTIIEVGPIIQTLDGTGQDLGNTTAPTAPAPEAPVGPAAAARSIRLPQDADARVVGADGDAIQSASNAGDVNGDNVDDAVVMTQQGASVVFGGSDTARIELANLGNDGFFIPGATAVHPVGDVNGDQNDDLGVAGAAGAFVVYGKQSSGDVTLDSLAPADGITFNLASGATAASVSSAGDLNGDGQDDIAISDPQLDGGGAAWVVYTSNLGDGSGLDLQALVGNGSGFKISTTDPSAEVGSSVSPAGDVNGSGPDDLIVGAPGAGGGSGAAYVIYGQDGGAADDLDVSQPGDWGFAITGSGSSDAAGTTTAKTGDFDGDGADDVLVGGPGASPKGRDQAGAAYVIRGGDQLTDVSLDDPGDAAIEIDGPAPGGGTGSIGTAAAADAEPDGSVYLVLGAGGLDAPAAQGYVVYGGSADPIDLRSPSDHVVPIKGDATGPVQVAAGLDLDDNGSNDVLAVIGNEADAVAPGGQ